MSSKKVILNPVFQALVEIQQSTDVCPNPQDSDFKTCRTKTIRGERCRNRPCRKDERWHTPSLLLEFQNMAECPNTKSFHEKMKTFVTYTHCKGKHRDKVLGAFDAWKKKKAIDELISERSSTPSASLIETTIQPITTAALQLLPSTPAQSRALSDYATSDDGTSFVESIADTRSVTSNTTCMTSLPNTPLRNGTVSRFHIEDVAEEECASEPIFGADDYIDSGSDEEVIQEDAEQDVFEDAITKNGILRGDIIASDIKRERDGERIQESILNTRINTPLPKNEQNDERKDKEEKRGDNEGEDSAIEGLGIIGIQRTLSLRDHSPVFQVINGHPTPSKMREGVVYILEHEKNPSLFKIGWSSKSAKERLKQPRNCYGKNTKVFYETKRFVGAPQAERIAQVILRHVNIRVSECFYCQGGHREWFAAPRETVHETVMHVEEFLRMPAYTLQDKVYKLSPEVYERVVKQMCDFSVARFGELMHGPRKQHEETEISDVLIDAKVLPLAQLTLQPVEKSRLNASDGLSEFQDSKSFVSTSSHDTKSQNLTAGVKLMRKVKWLFSISDSVRAYLSDL
ncbi:hypothetical protein TRIATDRAFT_307656 [Trichoderma atroviride IMI 206040]|uniref:Bacteriophage T5 Orf172 DNA-binding domain-containing protein n=1 Tax=Hypocrea atroviridis (strain ATCC 20476 / IMI 206040) TaxID=452589 RepID=G9NUA2_HYPAI|nr:uncharacterized protein TRIATDRAFT_307656 [Trichoderma atroviride IMI 206040]EHK45635.1 hypothetical protein TRIATDRAFT_307656 [Trichoderma atroviride IMI 206040]